MSWQSLGLLAKTNAANAFTVGGHTITNDAIGTVPLAVKAIASQTANLQTWTDSASAVLAQVTAGGSIASGANGTFGTLTSLARLTVVNGTSSVVGAVIRGAASQSANLQEWQNSAGSLVANMSPAGTLVLYGSGITSGDHRVGTATYYSASLNVSARSATEIGAVVRGFTSQSANLQEWQNSAGTVLASVNSSGGLSVATLVSTAGTIRANAGLGSSTVALSSLVSNVAGGHLVLQNITVTPNTPSGAGVLYVESGALKYKGSSGTVTTIAAA
jgi:hypothetical protein